MKKKLSTGDEKDKEIDFYLKMAIELKKRYPLFHTIIVELESQQREKMRKEFKSVSEEVTRDYLFDVQMFHALNERKENSNE